MNKLNFIRSDLANLEAYIPIDISQTNQILDRLDANESPVDLPIELKEKLASIYTQQILNNRYPDGSHLDLKNAIASYVNESANLQEIINNNNISVGNGSDELIRSLLIATCLGGEGSILVANPTFSMYQIIAETFGIPVKIVNRFEQDFSINLDQANQQLISKKNPPIRVIFVVHPNSPTGNCLTETEINWLKNIPENILVVIDEAYFEFSQTTLVTELFNHPNWVILRTFSKAFRLATHRVGYAIASPEIITILEKIRLPYNLPSFSQIAAQLVLENRALILPSVTKIIEERERLYNSLKQDSRLKVWQSDANFIYVQLAENSTAENLNKILKNLEKQGTLIRHTGGGLRITIGTELENNRTIERITKILNYSNGQEEKTS